MFAEVWESNEAEFNFLTSHQVKVGNTIELLSHLISWFGIQIF